MSVSSRKANKPRVPTRNGEAPFSGHSGGVISQRNMRSTKRLRSVVHSIAHHAMSGLCYVHPHLGQARKPLGAERVTVDLLNSRIEPSLSPPTREIELSTHAFRETFSRLLETEALQISDLTAAAATFFFKGDSTWPDGCLVEVETPSGIKLEDAVGFDGHRAEILRDKKLLHATRETRAREQ